jgi:hypothetical protein
MAGKIVPPKLEPIQEPIPPPSAVSERPELRSLARRSKPLVDSLIVTGFVTDAAPPERIEPDDTLEGITIEAAPAEARPAGGGRRPARRSRPTFGRIDEVCDP